jgi:uracil phosphoribosyltransferase
MPKKIFAFLCLCLGLMSTTLAGVEPQKNDIFQMVKKFPQYPNLHIIDHPLVQHKLSLMRDKKTSTNQFRTLLKEISLLMSYELTRDFPITTKAIQTPVNAMQAPVISGKKVAVVPILRAGLGMADGLLDLIPSARVGHIGLYRDEKTKMPKEYFVKIPKDSSLRTVIVVDPMLATGNSLIYAINLLNKRGVKDENIRVMTLVSAPEGVKNMFKTHPKVKVFTGALDQKLNAQAFIVPGLGDAGDRIFGTK